MKRILIVYYTQSGQLKEIIDKVISGFSQDETVFDLHEIKPVDPYPFPWSNDTFFDAFPESVQGIPCKLEESKIDTARNYDMVVLAYQVWYLSPSIPFWSFLMSEDARKVIEGRPVVTLLGVRNMWIMAQEKVKRQIHVLGGNLVGNIVLQDRHQNLVSVVTIVHWLYTADNCSFGIFPPAGVSDEDIRSADRFGEIIEKHLPAKSFSNLQEELVSAGAVRIIPDLMSIEKKAIHIFRAWSKFILKKGEAGDPARKGRVNLFRIYLFTVIYLVSPIVSLLFYLTYVFAFRRIRRNMHYYKLMIKKKK